MQIYDYKRSPAALKKAAAALFFAKHVPPRAAAGRRSYASRVTPSFFPLFPARCGNTNIMPRRNERPTDLIYPQVYSIANIRFRSKINALSHRLYPQNCIFKIFFKNPRLFVQPHPNRQSTKYILKSAIHVRIYNMRDTDCNMPITKLALRQSCSRASRDSGRSLCAACGSRNSPA